MNTLHIAYDSREQHPVHDLAGVEVSKGVVVKYSCETLNTFDYCVHGDWRDWEGHKTKLVNFGIERKSVGDFIGSFFSATNSHNERKKIERARKAWGVNGLPIVYVIEGNHEDIGRYNYSRFPSGRITAKVVLAKMRELRCKGVHVVLCPHRAAAEYEIVSMLKWRWRKIKFDKRVGK